MRYRNYISSFEWSLPITVMYFAYGIGGILALFLVEFVEAWRSARRLELEAIARDDAELGALAAISYFL